jgi:hypothetical protein
MHKGDPLKTKILIEDSYGPAFINKLIVKLKEKTLINTQAEITCDKFGINKIARLIKAQKIGKTKIMVIVDSDWGCNTGNAKNIIEICVTNMMNKRCTIKLKYEIEEWICTIKKMDYGREKPSKILKHKSKHEKYRLPDYASDIAENYQELINESDSFNQFIECLKRA